MNDKKSAYGNSIDDFEFQEKIGSGGFAEVFKAKCKNNGFKDSYVAIKKIYKTPVTKRRCKDEIAIHKQLSNHSAFVKLHASFEDEEYWYLVLELCTGGSFHEYIKRNGHLSEEKAVNLIRQVIKGVQYLHSELIIHRDLSLKNLLLTDNDVVKIADFGLSMQFNHSDEKTNTVLGTANFMSPEVVNHDSYDFKIDCWGVGCVLYALLYGSPPFNDKIKQNIVQNVKHSQLIFPDYASIEAKKLLKSLLNKDSTLRIDMKEALKSDLLQKYDKNGDINEHNWQKNRRDSGLSSLSSGSKKSQSTHTSAEYDNGSNHHITQKERKNRQVKNAPIARSRNNSHDNTKFNYQDDDRISQKQTFSPYQDSSNSPSHTSQNKDKFSILPSRCKFQYDTPIKNRLKCPSNSADLQYFEERSLNVQKNHSGYSSKNHSRKHSNSSKHDSDYRQNSCVDNYVDGTVKNPSCSHDQYCSENNCCHKLSCCCRQMRSNACSSSGYNSNVRNTVEEGLKNIVDPLNTARLSYHRKELESKEISILTDGQVCLQYFKLKEGLKYVHLVCLISGNGLQITIYKLKQKIILNPDGPPPLPHSEEDEVQHFTFENLPNIYCKKYRIAKFYVDRIRGFTPKVIIYGEHAKCIMMENTPNPNYEMNFYNGCQITESESNKTFTDKNGSVVTNNDDKYFMENEFEKMKQKCIMHEKNVQRFQDANFPAILGKKPDKSKRVTDNNKENIPPSSNGVNSGVKKSDVSTVTENSAFQNTFQRSISIPNSSEKGTSSSKNMANISSRVESLDVDRGWIIAMYKDDVQMDISMQDNSRVCFKDANTQELLPRVQYPLLMDRYYNDLEYILEWCALLKKAKTKT